MQFEFGFQDAKIEFLGQSLGTIRGLAYDEETPAETIPTNSPEPAAWAEGVSSYKGTLTILKGTLIALQNAAPNKKVGKLRNFDITIVEQKQAADTPVVTVIRVLRFTNVPVDLKAGNMFTEVALPFIAASIKNK